MMERSLETRAIQRAVDEGLLTAADVAGQMRELEAWGPRLAGLVAAGLVSTGAARRLLDDAGTPAAAAPPRALRGGGRFEIREPLGQGGMGQVFRAYDAVLRRHVAVKVLTSDDPERVARFLREAQAQARVDHENVCKIYEVGERDGKPYIAMQLIPGEPLFLTDGEATGPSPAVAQMSVEQKARLMQKVAEAIHAAHRQGLIHRDLKPSNIMLEAADDGSLKPYVLDFGLAREVASPNLTSVGLAAGTPSYMAPEQARGETASLDRRTDVYGLGSTLYALLAGRPPFDAENSFDVLLQVVEQDPAPLANVPRDLAAIVARCMEKDPALRYDSARAAAEDLRRYLDGEPVLARGAGLAGRLLRRVRRHRKVAAAAALAAAAFTALAAVSLRGQLRARERARLAGVFGQEVKAMESRMRIAQLAPEHDITVEKAAVRERMKAIEDRLETLGAIAAGPGHYALGHGHLTLGEHAEARRHLEQAWNGGYREPEVAYALGLVLGTQYQQELKAAERIADKARREQRKEAAQREYRDPALELLQRSRGLDVESPEYVEGLVAFYEKRYDAALAKARAAHARLPWLYEAWELEARVHLATGRDLHERGTAQAAFEAYGRAEAAYDAALEIARSSPTIAQGLCEVVTALLRTHMATGGEPIEQTVRKGLAACDRSIRVDRERGEAHARKAALLARLADRDHRGGRDPGQWARAAIAASAEALRLQPDEPQAQLTLGAVHQTLAWYQLERGVDPTAQAEESVRRFEAALRTDPNDVGALNALGAVYRQLGIWRFRVGGDPRPLLGKAEAAQKRAVAIEPGNVGYSNLSNTYADQVRYEIGSGQDPSAALARFEEATRKALAFNPELILDRRKLGEVSLYRARHQLSTSKDPRDNLRQAAAVFTSILETNPTYTEALIRMASVEQAWAAYESYEGRDPRPRLAEARDWMAKALATQRLYLSGLLLGTAIDLLEARWRLGQGLSPEAALARVERAAGEAARLDPGDLSAGLIRAESHLHRARWQRRLGRPAQAQIAAGLAQADATLAIAPETPDALALRGALCLERAEADPPRRGAHLACARESLERALALNGFLERDYGALLQQARASR